MTRDADLLACIAELEKDPIPYAAFEDLAPTMPGVYALWLVNRNALTRTDLAQWQHHGPLYVGKSGNLSVRPGTHFRSAASGRSTVRRSLGALLKTELQLTAIPRSPLCTNADVSNYKFQPDGEEQLTKWILSNTHVSFCSDGQRRLSANERKELEVSAIQHLKPPLCIKEWANPYKPVLDKVREVCRNEARRNCS